MDISAFFYFVKGVNPLEKEQFILRAVGKQIPHTKIPPNLLSILKEDPFVIVRPAIVKNVCQRCGNADRSLFGKIPCIHCKKDCLYCRACISLGRLTECTNLVTVHQEVGTTYDSTVVKNFTLSPLQLNASNRIVQSWKEKKNLLIWAVCGAGKTEMIVEGVYEALKANQKVCIAIPRVDVVIELSKRFQQFFPHLKISALYGNSPDRLEPLGPLVIATTHQLFHFYHYFDWMIVDEVDAFPYSVDASLRWAVQHAKKPEASYIYLTATPQKDIPLKDFSIVKIPIRYHGHLLDVPRFIWCGNWRKQLTKGKLPIVVVDWLKNYEPHHPILLFVPKVVDLPLVKKVLRWLNVETVHAADENRKEKVEAMRTGKIKVLVTTTILERGVTFENVAVAILGAEDDVFNKSALIQIAGRVGRKATHPSGPIAFFHYGKSIEMVKARQEIIEMNQLAKKYIKEQGHE